MPREPEYRPQENQVVPCCREVQVTVTTVTTVGCDAESRLPLPVGESLPALPPRMEGKGEFHPQDLCVSEEGQQIRTLEHQMKQDLDI